MRTPRRISSTDGAGINDDNGVLYNGVHTHFVHWKSATSFDIFGLPSTAHTVRVVLADQNHSEFANSEATKTLNFSVSQPPTGDLQLQSVILGLNFPVGMSLAPDGRVFFNERLTGNIRIINQQWQLAHTPFCQLTIATTGEQGLLGLALDPDFANQQVRVRVSLVAVRCAIAWCVTRNPAGLARMRRLSSTTCRPARITMVVLSSSDRTGSCT